MEAIYNYGISQEDALTEIGALQIDKGDSLLCIASAGEIPLNIAALKELKIVATDVSVNQIRLCRMKQVAATLPDSTKSAAFLGYQEMDPEERTQFYIGEIMPLLTQEDAWFWQNHSEAIAGGVVNAARFEKYMQKVSGIGQMLIGKKNLYKLFDCATIEEQRNVFDSRINGLMVKAIFNLAFHPWIYKNRGIDPAGLTHSGARNIAEFFFNRFRNFCCNTPARENYYLQYTFFGKVLFPEALPEFLQPTNKERLTRNIPNIEFSVGPIEDVLANSETGSFNKIHLSNIGDWQSVETMNQLFSLISQKTIPGYRIAMRYIHLHHPIPENIPDLEADYLLGRTLEQKDRYPFYSIVPIFHK